MDGPGVTRPSHARRLETVVAMVAVALVAGSAGGLATRELDVRTLAQPSTSTSPQAASSAPSSQLSGQSLDVASIVAREGPAVVTIHAQVSQGMLSGTSAGSGIVLTSTGEVLTNAHVVEGATSVQVSVAGQSGSQSAQVVGTDPVADIALLRISGASGLATAALGDSRDVRVGDDVVAIGDALDLSGAPTVTRGIVSGVNRSFDAGSGTMTGLIQTDAAISSGNSGGALIDASGQVIGIPTATAASSRDTTAQNMNFAIPIDRAISVARSLGATVSVPRFAVTG